MPQFNVYTEMLRSQAQKMQSCEYKIKSLECSVDSVARKLKDIAELSLSDVLIESKFRSIKKNMQSIAASFRSFADTLVDITGAYEAAQKYNMALCTGNTIGLSYEEILSIRADSAVEPVSRELYYAYLKRVKIADDAYSGTAYYDPNTRSITYNATKDSTNVTGVGCTYYHEVGHLIDDLTDRDGYNSVDERYNFYELLNSDFNDYVKNVMDKNGYTNINDAYRDISAELYTDKNMKDGISDIICGLTNGNCVGGWSHNLSYYTKDSIAIEAFAHFFEAGMSNQDTKLEYIKAIFPNAYNEYLKIAQDELDLINSINGIIDKVADFLGISNPETEN